MTDEMIDLKEARAEEKLRRPRLPLRIAITVDPEIPVPPKEYGGIERIVDMLVRGLVEHGHAVTLFAHRDSNVPSKLESYPGLKSRSTADLLKNMWYVSTKVLTGRFDLVHSFGRLAYLAPLLPLSIPKIMSYQRPITPWSVRWGEKLSRGTLHFVGLSRHIVQSYNGRPNWHVIYNGAPKDCYDFRDEVDNDAPLVFLGRIESIKGPDLAIQVALQSRRNLIIAGNIPKSEKHEVFFRNRIAPYLNGKNIQYVGPVTDAQKNQILGQAAALLMPVRWEEPFGIVMAEALACGTPIVGLRRGAVPEVVRDGVNGFVCDTIEEMVEAVGRIREVDRKKCREIMEEKFSDRPLIDSYEKLYFEILSDGWDASPNSRDELQST